MSNSEELKDPRDVLRNMQSWDEFNELNNQPTLVLFKEVFCEEASLESLETYIDEFDVLGVIRGLAHLGWLNDRSAAEGTIPHRELAESIDDMFGSKVAAMVDNGRVLLSRMSIAKLVEIIGRRANAAYGRPSPSLAHMGRMLAAANELCDTIAASYPDIDMVKALAQSESPASLQGKIDALDDAQYRDWVADFSVSQQLVYLHFRFDVTESLAPAFLDTWQTPCKIDQERWPLAKCMADLFKHELGVDLFEYVAIGMELHRRSVEGRGSIKFDGAVSKLMETVAGRAVREWVVLDLHSDAAALGNIYSQQRYPIILAGGEMFVADSQKLLRRFLDVPVELDLLSGISSNGPRKSELKRTLNSRFEARVNNRLKRIERSCHGATLYGERDLQVHFSKSSNRKSSPSCCDWVLSSPFVSIYFEATNRNMPFAVLDSSSPGIEFDGDLDKIYVKGKFRQIVSTFESELAHGLPGTSAAGSSPVHFGLVVLPRGGLTSDAALESILRSSTSDYMPARVDYSMHKWLPIGILNESDLILLEGWAEHRRIDVSRLLYEWRYMAAQNPAPFSLEEFASLQGLDRPFPSRDLKRAAFFKGKCVEALDRCLSG